MNKSILYISVISLVFILMSCSRTDRDYYANGNLKQEIPYSHGKIDGIAKWWYEDGTLMQQAEYREGVLNGKSFRWFNHGVMENEETFKDGHLNGLSREWSRTGKLIREVHYFNDTLDGPAREWYPLSGSRKIEGSYKNGMYEGRWYYFNKQEKVIGEAVFSNGTGMRRTWDSYGNLIQTTEYKNNMKHGRETIYDKDGNVLLVVHFENDEQVEAPE